MLCLYMVEQGFNLDALALKPSLFPAVNPGEALTQEK